MDRQKEQLQGQAGGVTRGDAADKPRAEIKLTPFQQRILGLIAARSAMSEGEVFRSKKWISEQVHCDMKTVDRAIARLRKEGMIVVEERYGENGGQLPNVYRVAR